MTDAASVNELWESVKATEKPRTSVFDGLPPGLPALLLADKVLDRAERAGDSRRGARRSDDLGDRLLALVAEARAAGVDPEHALRDAVRRTRPVRRRGAILLTLCFPRGRLRRPGARGGGCAQADANRGIAVDDGSAGRPVVKTRIPAALTGSLRADVGLPSRMPTGSESMPRKASTQVVRMPRVPPYVWAGWSASSPGPARPASPGPMTSGPATGLNSRT